MGCLMYQREKKEPLLITIFDNLFWCVGSVDVFGIILYKKLDIFDQWSKSYFALECPNWNSNLKQQHSHSTVAMYHSRSQQRTDQRVLVLTLKILALKRTGFSPVKYTSQNSIDFFLLLFYATFQCRPYNIFKKISN